MKTKWDYSDLAEAYLKRPNYSDEAIKEMIKKTSVETNDNVCDIGAGVAHLTIKLAENGLKVTAIEPNNNMRKYGIERTKEYNNVEWFEAVGEDTQQPSSKFDLVTFGSSFNVVNQQVALNEAVRILKNNGWFACMWNHRDLNDPIQKEIENTIKSYIKDYDYGVRRKDQSGIIKQNSNFNEVFKIEGRINHDQNIEEWLDAWRSHATLKRKDENNFKKIIKKIKNTVYDLEVENITIPYITRIWMSKVEK